MMFVKDQGIVTTRAQLVALLAFTGDGDKLDGVGFQIDNEHLTAWSSDGHSCVYHHSTATDGSGGDYSGQHEWQVEGDVLRRVVKAMEKGDEAVFTVGTHGELRDARVREIESGTEKIRVALGDHVSSQISIDLPSTVPTRPVPVDQPVFQIGLDTELLARLRKVARAAACDVCRFTLPSDQCGPLYFEVDQMGALADTGRVAWVGVIMPVRMDNPED